jgi:hypothetical protein
MIAWYNLEVGYLCACFLGRRLRNDAWDESLPNPALTHILRQLEAIERCATVISKVTFVCNTTPDNEEQEQNFQAAQELITSKLRSDIQWEVVRRPNFNISYGAWDWGLKEIYSDFDYVFTVEDDYVPDLVGFDREVIQRYFSDEYSRENVVKAASLWVDDTLFAHDRNQGSNALRAGLPHAAISNGVVNVSVYAKVAKGFRLPSPPIEGSPVSLTASGKVRQIGDFRTNEGWNALQMDYLKNHTDAGYRVINMGQHYSAPFVDTGQSRYSFGATDGPVLFTPV